MISATQRSGCVAANNWATSVVSAHAITTAPGERTASSTRNRSSVSDSIGGIALGENRSESPVPRRSVMISRLPSARPRRKSA
jgi:hypothetical protein